MKYDIFCFKPGDHSTFTVNINENGLVDHLKDKIKARKHPELKHVAADKLKLYRVEVDEWYDKKMRISELERLSQNLNECLELEDELQKMSALFKSPPQGKNYFTLVQVPKGKSIYCGAVVLKADGVDALVLPSHSHPLRLPTVLSMLRRFHLPRRWMRMRRMGK